MKTSSSVIGLIGCSEEEFIVLIIASSYLQKVNIYPKV